MENAYKILKYLRLSLDDENDGESNSIQYQRKLIDNYISEHFKRRDLFVDEIVDDGYSGTNFKRPGVTKALELLNKKKFDCIIVKDLSRLGRDHIQVGNYLEHIFPAMEIRVISINDQYDSDEHIGSPGGIDIALKNLIYEMYSKDLSQKVKAARYTMMKTGKYNAPFPIYGYIKYNDSLIIDDVAGKIVARIFDMIDSGMLPTAVAAELNKEGVLTPASYKKSQNCKRRWNYDEKKPYWTDSTIRRIISDEKYIGKMVLGKTERMKVGDPCSARRKPIDKWVVVENTHPAIVSQEKFNRVAERVHTRKMHHGNHVNYKPSIYRCGYCGHVLQKTGKVKTTLKCRYALMNTENDCLREGVDFAEIQDLLRIVLAKQFEIMQYRAKEYKDGISVYSGISADVFAGEMTQLKRQRFSAYEKFKDGEISREELDNVRDSVTKRMDELESLSQKAYTQEEISEDKMHKADIILNYGNEESFDENFINYFISKVKIYNNKQVEITWNFGLNEFLNENGGQMYA